MKWLAILLMFANVALYLWMSGYQGQSGLSNLPAKPEVNRTGMLLLSETRKPAAAPGITLSRDPRMSPSEAVPESQLTADNPAAGGSSVVSPGKAPNDALMRAPKLHSGETEAEQRQTCYRIGPFREKRQLDQVAGLLREDGIDYRLVKGRGRELRATRVFLGPFSGRAEVRAMVSRLKALGLESYIYGREEELRVSLGYFTQEEFARKFTSALQQKGIEAQTEPEFKSLEPLEWLEIRLDADRKKAVEQREWSEQAVKLQVIDCVSR